VAAKINALELRAGEQFHICKREKPEGIQWDVWLASESEQRRAADEPASELEVQLSKSLEIAPPSEPPARQSLPATRLGYGAYGAPAQARRNRQNSGGRKMTVIGCLRTIDNAEPNARCALPEGHKGPHGPAFSAALRPHAFVLNSESGACIICHCLPRHVLHLMDDDSAPSLAQPPDPEATEPALRDEHETGILTDDNATRIGTMPPAFDPIERYLKLFQAPNAELPFLAGDVTQMAIATALLLGVKELRALRELLSTWEKPV
jgi:hypothetical protein